MTIAEAEEFYGPVRHVLREKLKNSVAERSAKAVGAELGMVLPETAKGQLGELLGPLYGDNQFYQIVQFMTGRWGEGLADEEKQKPGTMPCLLLVWPTPLPIRGICAHGLARRAGFRAPRIRPEYHGQRGPLPIPLRAQA